MELTQNIMFVSLGFNLPRQSRKVTAQSDVDPQRLKASAKLYSGTAFKAIQSADAATRADLLKKAIRVPSSFAGTYILPAAMVSDVRQLLAIRADERATLVDSFLQNDYEIERTQARIALNGSFREDDFPPASVLKKYFQMKSSIFTLEIPQGLPDDVREEEVAKYRENMESVFSECRSVLRNTLADLVGHLADRLKPEPDGSRKRLTRTTVDNLREFLDTVNARDITSDDAIRDISAKARDILKTYSADQLKNRYYGDEVQRGLERVKGEIDTLIQRDGGRKIDLDME